MTVYVQNTYFLFLFLHRVLVIHNSIAIETRN